MKLVRKILLVLFCLSYASANAGIGSFARWSASAAKAACVKGVVKLVTKGAKMCYNRVMRTIGFDVDSVNDDTSNVVSDDQKQIPHADTVPAQIAEGTVPQELAERIRVINEQHYDGGYNYTTFKPILLVGASGTGKTELAHYLAQQIGCPLLCQKASSLLGGVTNSGAENVCSLFRRARRRSIPQLLLFKVKQLVARIMGHIAPKRKPSVILLDEIGSFSQKRTLLNHLNDGDQPLEEERRKALDRLFWEINRNPYFSHRPNMIESWKQHLDEKNEMRKLLEGEDTNKLFKNLPHCSCQPSDAYEKSMVYFAKTALFSILMPQITAMYKINKEVFYNIVSLFFIVNKAKPLHEEIDATWKENQPLYDKRRALHQEKNKINNTCPKFPHWDDPDFDNKKAAYDCVKKTLEQAIQKLETQINEIDKELDLKEQKRKEIYARIEDLRLQMENKIRQLSYPQIMAKFASEFNNAIQNDLMIPMATAIFNNPDLIKEAFGVKVDQQIVNTTEEKPKETFWQRLKRNVTQKFLVYAPQYAWKFYNWVKAKDDTDTLVIATTTKSIDELDPLIKDTFQVIEMKDLTACQRASVLKFHANGKSFGPGVNIQDYVDKTDKYSSADLAYLVNQAGRLMASSSYKSPGNSVIQQVHLAKAYEQLVKRRCLSA